MSAFKLIDDLRRDAVQALRAFGRQPGFAALVVLTLGLGIGATTAMYSAIDAAFFRPLPFPQPSELVRLNGLQESIDIPRNDATPRRKVILELADLEGVRDVFPLAAAYATGSRNLESGLEPRRVEVTFVTDQLFAVLGRDAALGRVFTRDEMTADRAKVVVLSDRLWRSHFAADPELIGRTVVLDNEAHEVVGVMPPDFRFPAEAQLWAPLPRPVPLPLMNAFRNFLPANHVARLADGVAIEAARARFEALRAAVVAPRGTGDPPRPPATVTPLQRFLVGDRSTTLAVLMMSAALVLLVACANAATLLFARALARGREIAVHAALGATRARLARRLLVESVLLAGLASGIGVAIATVSLPLLQALLPERLVGLAAAEIDWRVLAFALGAALATGLAFGLVPALGASRVRPGEALKSGGERSTRSRRIGNTLVVVQVGLAAVLVVISVLMIASLRTLLETDVGLSGLDRVASARLNVPTARYETNTAFAELVQKVVERLEQAPIVEVAGAINALPFDPATGVRIRVDLAGVARDTEVEGAPFAPYRVVSPGYLKAIGLELVRGRDIAWSDRRAEPVAVIDRTLAERLWPGEDPLGKRIEYLGGPRTVVGVVAEARISDLAQPSEPQVYVPMHETVQSYLSFVVRGREEVDAASLLPLLRDAVRAVDPLLPVYAAEPMETVLAGNVAPRRLNTWLSGTFGAVALALAAIGVYGVLAYSVVQRRREIGIRVALGAQAANVARGVLRESLLLVVCGVALGFLGALGAARYLESLLYGVTAREPLAFGAVAVLFLGVAAAAAWLPARAAAGVDPLTAIRHE
jgi:predicted permease